MGNLYPLVLAEHHDGVDFNLSLFGQSGNFYRSAGGIRLAKVLGHNFVHCGELTQVDKVNC
jgi:hypothetical protein